MKWNKLAGAASLSCALLNISYLFLYILACVSLGVTGKHITVFLVLFLCTNGCAVAMLLIDAFGLDKRNKTQMFASSPGTVAVVTGVSALLPALLFFLDDSLAGSAFVPVLGLSGAALVLTPVAFLIAVHRRALTVKKTLKIGVKVLLSVLICGFGFFFAVLIFGGGIGQGAFVLAGRTVLSGNFVLALLPAAEAVTLMLLLWGGGKQL